jgi:hypothetical protein
MKRSVFILFFVCCFSAVSAVSSFAQDIPFTIEKGFIVVPAKIQKTKPVEVVLATGMYMSSIEGQFDKYGLTAAYTAEGIVTGRNDRTISFVSVSDIVVGEAKPTSLNLALNSPLNASKQLGREIFAILGVDFFRGKILQFDFNKKVVRFLDKSPFSSPKEGTTTENGITRMTFEISSLTRSPFAPESAVPIVEGILFNDKKVRTLLNTGVGTPVMVSPGTVKDLALEPVPEKGKAVIGKVKSIKIFDLALDDIPAVFYGKDAGFEQRESKYEAVFGVALLKNFTATFDFKEKVVILERPAQK